MDSPGTEMAASDRWGPFAEGLDAGERLSRPRSTRVIVSLSCGPRGAPLADALGRAGTQWPAGALAVLNRLADLDRRQVLTSFARL